MKLLFIMRHSGYVRNFESTLRMLCEHGHVVHLAFQGQTSTEQLGPTQSHGNLPERFETFTFGEAPLRVDGWGPAWTSATPEPRLPALSRPEYRSAPKLRKRATRDVPPWIVQRERGLLSTPAGRAALSSSLQAMDAAIPTDPAIDGFIRQSKPDVLLVTPLIEPGSPQVDYVRSARAQGIPTALCVASWDNLTNKGLIHAPVDLVAVWNDAMKDEAVRFHGIAPEKVAVTGAAAFDHWFDWRPSTTREAFCARVGLRPDRPYLLYLCSSRFVAPHEVPFVRRWVEHIRRSTGAVREAGILVRPHPQNAQQWRDVDFGAAPTSLCGPAPALHRQTRSHATSTRFDLSQRRRRRCQYDGRNRERDRGTQRLYGSCARISRHTGRDAPLPSSSRGERRPGAHGARSRRTRRATRDRASRSRRQ